MSARSIRRFAWVTVFVLLALLAAGYVALRNIDLAAYRPQIIAQVEAATGRSFAIGEDLAIGLRNGLAIRARDLVLGNADWGSRPNMLRIGQAEARVALLPLLRGEINITRIDLHGLDLLLETDAAGRGNWEIDGKGGEGGPGLQIDAVTVRSGTVTWRDRGGDQGRDASPPLRLELRELVARDRGARLDLEADGQLREQPFTLAGQMTSPRRWAGTQPIELDLELRAGDTAPIGAAGTLERADWGLKPSLKFTAEGLEPDKLGQLAGLALPPLPALDIAFELGREPQAWQIDGLSARAGRSDLGGMLRWSDSGDRPRLSAELSAATLDVVEWLPPPRKAPAPANGAARIFPATAFELSPLKGFDATLALHVEQLVIPRQPLAQVRLDGRLHDAVLELDLAANAAGGDGRLSASARLDAGGTAQRWTSTVTLKGVPAALLQAAPETALVQAPADLDLKLQAQGASPREIARSLAGQARLLIGQGRARLKAVDTLTGGLITVAGQLFEHGSTDTRLNCLIADFDIAAGVATTRVVLIDSSASTVRADGTVDLGAERIDLRFTPRPKRPTITVAVPVHVRGDLKDPEFQPDRTASLTKLIGVAGIFVYPPAAIAALGDLGTSGNACAELLRGDAAAGSAPSTTDKIRQGVGDAADQLGRGLRRLFGD